MTDQKEKTTIIFYYPGKITYDIAIFIQQELQHEDRVVHLVNVDEEFVQRGDDGILLLPILGDVRLPKNVEQKLLTCSTFPKEMMVCVIGDYDEEPTSCEVANETMRLLTLQGVSIMLPPLLLDSPFVNYRKIKNFLQQERKPIHPTMITKEMPPTTDANLQQIIDVLGVIPRFKVNEHGKCMMLSLETCDEYPRSLLANLTTDELKQLECLINKLPELQELRVPYAEWEEWPFAPTSFPQIKSLDLRGSSYSSYHFLSFYQQLIKVNLGANNLDEIPASVFSLQHLEILFIYKNFIHKIPREITQLKKLRWLSMYRNQVKTLPSELANLENLEKLNIGANPIENLPDLPQVKYLVLRNCKLTTLPFNFQRFFSLQELGVTKNALKEENICGRLDIKVLV